MKPTATLGVLVPILLCFVLACSQESKSTLPLQEKCSEGAARFVKHLDAVIAYESHYNKKLDKCFVRVGFYFGHTEEKTNLKGKEYTMKHPQSSSALYDAFEGTLIGRHYLNGGKSEECYVGNTKCKTQGDMIDNWNSLAKPYMEE